jgi:hypothetical protein
MLAADEKILRMKSGKARYWLTLPAEMKSAYPALGVPEDVGTPAGARSWAAIVRDEFLAALGSSHNRLLEAALCARSISWFGVKCFPAIADVKLPPAAQGQRVLACQNLQLAVQSYSLEDGEGQKIDGNRVESLWIAVLDRPPSSDTTDHEVRVRLKLKTVVMPLTMEIYCKAKSGGGEFECPAECDAGVVSLSKTATGGFQVKLGASGLRLEDCNESAVTILQKNLSEFVALAAASSGQCPIE